MDDNKFNERSIKLDAERVQEDRAIQLASKISNYYFEARHCGNTYAMFGLSDDRPMYLVANDSHVATCKHMLASRHRKFDDKTFTTVDRFMLRPNFGLRKPMLIDHFVVVKTLQELLGSIRHLKFEKQKLQTKLDEHADAIANLKRQLDAKSAQILSLQQQLANTEKAKE